MGRGKKLSDCTKEMSTKGFFDAIFEKQHRLNFYLYRLSSFFLLFRAFRGQMSYTSNFFCNDTLMSLPSPLYRHACRS